MQTTDIAGYYMMKGCSKGTYIYLLAFYSFTFGYYYIKYKPHSFLKQNIINSFDKDRISLLCFRMWIICFCLSLIYYVFGTGLSIMYILSIGMTGDVSMASDTPLKFLINFSWSMLPFWLLYVITSKSKAVKIIMTILTLSIYIIGGTRFIVILMVGALAWSYYLGKGKKIGMKEVIISIAFFLTFTTLMAQYRNDIRAGLGSKNVKVEESAFYDNFFTNTNIILPYYCIVDKIPSEYPYYLGKGYFIEPLYYLVPRAIYPQKPGLGDADIVRAMVNSTGFDVCGQFGMATPFLSEMYLEFGPVGILILMTLIGVFLAKYKKKYLNPNRSIYDLAEYSITYFAIFQIFIRGYMSMNIYMMLFLILPIYYLRKKINISQ